MAAKGKVESFELNGRACACFVPESGVKHIAVLCGWRMAEMLPALAEEIPETALFFAEADGSRDFTPWPAEPVWEGEPFYGEAAGYLHFLTDCALPYLAEKFGVADAGNRLIAGYSLGGLFALWAACETEEFGRMASLSGSTWYPGFLDYIKAHMPREAQRVYLSLGDREPFGGPPVLREVGRCTEELYALLQEAGRDVTFEWNRGGHGKGIENRWRKALRAMGWRKEKL
ncbi:MAG: alpha/beta hydrolase [Clostridia bacterium]|nr:alpha/beta hydrolase [Clostridia bacterium]